MPRIGDFHRWERFLGIVDEQFIHFLVADERQLAGQGIDVHLGSDSGTSCPEGCIHLGVGPVDGIHGLGPDIGLDPHIVGHIVHQVPAFGDDGMDPDSIVIPESLPQGIDSHDSQHGGIQGIDSLVRSISGVGGFPHILDGLAVAAGTDGHHRLRSLFLGMDHHGHVDVIEFPFVD